MMFSERHSNTPEKELRTAKPHSLPEDSVPTVAVTQANPLSLTSLYYYAEGTRGEKVFSETSCYAIRQSLVVGLSHLTFFLPPDTILMKGLSHVLSARHQQL